MADLTNSTVWENGIYQLETTDPVQAGAGGISNRQAQQLSNRTNWLRAELYTQPFRQFISATSNTTIPAANVGAAYVAANQIGDGDIVFTLPSAASVAVGKGYYFISQSVGGFNAPLFARIDTVSSQLIRMGTATRQQIWLKPGLQFWLVSDGTGWQFIGERSPLHEVGKIDAFSYNDTPEGWLPCMGLLLSRTKYSDLFARIGTTYGAGDGSTTFATPNLLGVFLRGIDNGRGIDPDRAMGALQRGSLLAIDSTGVNQLYVANITSEGITPSNPQEVARRTGLDYVNQADYPNTNAAYVNGDGTGGFFYGAARPINMPVLYCIKY